MDPKILEEAGYDPTEDTLPQLSGIAFRMKGTMEPWIDASLGIQCGFDPALIDRLWDHCSMIDEISGEFYAFGSWWEWREGE